MKKVFFLIGKLSNGGAERVVSNLSLELPKELDKKIILFGDDAEVDYPYNGELMYLDTKKQKNITYIYKIYMLFDRIKKLKRIKKENQNEAMISFLEYPNLLNLLTRKYGKTIISVRNHMSSKHVKGVKALFWNSTIKLLYGKADLIIAVSEEIKKDLVLNYGISEKKIKVIYNSYDIDKIESLLNEDVENEYIEIFENPVVITVGRLNKQKGQWHLIRAFKEVSERIPNAQLVILGQGNLEKYLKELTIEFGISEKVHFLGFKENPFKYISKSKVFVMPSLNEGFPNALAEAMVCNIPIISSDCLSGPREILSPTEFNKDIVDYNIDKSRYGILLPMCDGNMYSKEDKLTEEEMIMAESIINIINNEDIAQYFSNRAIERIKNFNIKNIIEEWKSII